MRSPLRPVALVVAVAFLAACGSSDDTAGDTTAASTTAAPTTAPATIASTTSPATTATATTAPPTTAAPTTAPATTAPATTAPPAPVEPSLGEPVVAEQGFLSMSVADGWNVESVNDQLGRVYEDEPGLTWEASTDSIVDLISLTNGDTQLGVYREGRFGLAPDVFEWDRAIADMLGIQSNIDLTVEWGGGRGESTRGRIGDGYVRHESVAVGDQLIGVLALTPEQPSEQLDADVSAMIDSIVVDPAALLPLSHGLDVSGFTDAEDGSSTFEFSFVVPPHWQYDEPTDSWIDVWAEAADPEGPIGYLGFYGQPDTRPLDEVAATELEEFGNDWLDLDPDIEQLGDIGGADALVIWEGPRADAEAAIMIATDGAASASVYIWTPGDPALAMAIVDTALVIESARLPID